MTPNRDLAQELNISFYNLLQYAKYLGISLIDLQDGNLSESQINEIRNCHFNLDIRSKVEQQAKEAKERRELLRVKKEQRTEKILNLFTNHYGYDKIHYFKILAQVKWFYNSMTRKEEGYLNFRNKLDIYFLGKQVADIEPQDLRKGDWVVVSINKHELHRSRINASKVKPLEKEDDLFFLLDQILNPAVPKVVLLPTLKMLKEVELDIPSSEADKLYQKIDNLLEKGQFTSQQAIAIQAICLKLGWFPEIKTADNIYSKLDDEQKLIFWKTTGITGSFEVFKSAYLLAIKKGDIQLKEIATTLNYQENVIFLKDALKQFIDKKTSFPKEYIIELFQVCKDYQISLDTESLEGEYIFMLWSKKLLNTFPENIVLTKLSSLYDQCQDLSKDDFSYVRTQKKSDLKNILKQINDPSNFRTILNTLIKSGNKLKELDLYRKLVFFTTQWNDLFPDSQLNHQDLNFYPFESVYKEISSTRTSLDKIEIQLDYGKQRYFDWSNTKENGNDLIIWDALIKIDSHNLKKIYDRSIYEIESIDSDDQYQHALYFLKLLELLGKFIDINVAPIRGSYFDKVYSKSSQFYKTCWFIEDYTDELDYSESVIYTVILSTENQKVFFKKLLKCIAKGTLDLTFSDLKRIVTVDYELSEKSAEIDGHGLDYTLSVIFKLIQDLQDGTVSNSQSIFELVARQIKKPDDLLSITGFFDKCEGRTIYESEEKTKKDETIETSYHLKTTDYKAQYSHFCAGRKAINKTTGETSKCKRSNFEFWWCENSKCYQTSRKLHSTDNWKSYNLEDTLNILQIEYSHTQYEILLNVINRVNRFLQHLTCRSCKTILKPKGKSNYGFYGVTHFRCDKNDCEKYNEEIYLTHCLNPKCFEIIDSRDSIKCKPKDNEEGGWYICNNCYGCCTTEKIERRINILNYTGQTYNGHKIGHRELGTISCKDCGCEMNSQSYNEVHYKKVLNWFIDNRISNNNIIKSGERRDGKWWFIWAQGNMTTETYRKKLGELKLTGFNIPDFNDELKDSQLIAEPFNNNSGNNEIFKCSNCENILDMKISEEMPLSRKITIVDFHKKAMGHIKVQQNKD